MTVRSRTSYQADTRPRTGMGAGTVATAFLTLLVLATGCTSQQESPAPQGGRPGLPSPLLGEGPSGQPRVSNGPIRFVLPPYLAGHPAIPAAHTAPLDESATPRGRGCSTQVRGLLRAISRGDRFAAPAATKPKVAARAYGAAGHPAIWAMALPGGNNSGRDLPMFLRGAPRQPRCLNVDYILRAGGIRVSAARMTIRALGHVRILRARLQGDTTLMVACASAVKDSACRGAMIELVHFLGL